MALAILMLQEAGELDVNDLVCNYVPNCPENWATVEIRHLLTHSTGLSCNMNAAYNPQLGHTPATPTELLTRIQERPPPGFPPGIGCLTSTSRLPESARYASQERSL